MNKNNLKLLLFSFINLIAVFLPYGLIFEAYSLYVDKNCYLWKMFNFDLGREGELAILDAINACNAMMIIIVAILTFLLSVVYVHSSKKFLETVIKRLAIVSVVLNLLFSYNLTEPFCYKFINIGMILAFLSNILIIFIFSEFRKENWLIIFATLIIVFPSIITDYQVDIDGGIYAIPCSIQMYILWFIYGIVYEYQLWMISIPVIVMIVMVLLMMISVLGNLKSKNGFVVCSIISFVIMFVFEIVLATIEKISIIPTFTYVVAIVLLVTYLVIDKKESKRSI